MKEFMWHNSWLLQDHIYHPTQGLVFFVLTDKQQTILPEASLTENLFHAFGLTWMLQMIFRKYH